MHRRRITYFKSLLLLLAFGLHTVTGFACSVSPMLHNLHHSLAGVAKKTDKPVPPCHAAAEDEQEKKSTDEDCCSAAVALMQKAEKFASRSIDAPDALFFTSLLTSFFQWQPSAIGLDKQPCAYNRWRQPGSPPDLCITLRTFRI